VEAGHPFIDRSKRQKAKHLSPHLLAAQALDGAQVLAVEEGPVAESSSRAPPPPRLMTPECENARYPMIQMPEPSRKPRLARPAQP
jgi:hypothetical protein